MTIARAILQDAPIVILDEATAHADPLTFAGSAVALTVTARRGDRVGLYEVSDALT